MSYQFILESVSDLNDTLFCRTCLLKNDDLQSIFTKDDTLVKNYAEMLMEVAPIKITEADIFPLKICHACILNVQQAYEFQQKCIQAHEYLSHLFQQNVKLEENIKLEEINNSFNNSSIDDDNDDFKTFEADDYEVLSEKSTDLKDIIADESEDEVLSQREQRKQKLSKTDKKHQCSLCPMNFITKYKLTCHMLVHTKEKPFICDICGNKFTSNGNLKRHVKAHKGERDFRCDFPNCEKSFCQKVTLIEHRRIHTGEKPFQCPLCDKCFKTSSCLRQHRLGASHGGRLHPPPSKIEIKSNERHECGECGKTYATKNGLYQHSLRHSDKRLICPFCNKEFVSYAGLQQHKHAQHSEDHKFQCNLCGKIFKYQVVFKTHMLIHSGVKPYKCQYCTKTFTQKGHVVSHERLHTGVKPYQCEFCKKMFRHLTTLRDHRRIHTGEVPFKCDICNRGFYNSTTMKKHLLTHKQ